MEGTVPTLTVSRGDTTWKSLRFDGGGALTGRLTIGTAMDADVKLYRK